MPTINDDAKVEQLVSDHLYLVQHIVHELAARYPRHVDRQELWSAGAMGLVETARRFDPDSDVPFAHYARIRIRGAIIDSTRTRDWATRGVRRGQRDLEAAAASFEQRHHRPANPAELAGLLGITEDEVARRRAAAHRSTVLHLDQPLGSAGDDAAALADTIASLDVETSPEKQLEQRELIGSLRTGVRFLADNQRDIIERYYLRGERLRDIADEMGVTEARVSQLRSEAVRALQSLLAEANFGAPGVDPEAPGKRSRAAFLARVAENTTWQQRLAAADAPGGALAPGMVTTA
ncbi:MAG: sigma-70 family RNA polymerase sigma factor [Nitriliruptor sp.]|uniref:sigma-70 family RNA polymerase sigma factor n=1 Tax=Nitriliruptor sp. TaxID=2448056 RepID=UPI00349FE63C